MPFSSQFLCDKYKDDKEVAINVPRAPVIYFIQLKHDSPFGFILRICKFIMFYMEILISHVNEFARECFTLKTSQVHKTGSLHLKLIVFKDRGV